MKINCVLVILKIVGEYKLSSVDLSEVRPLSSKECDFDECIEEIDDFFNSKKRYHENYAKAHISSYKNDSYSPNFSLHLSSAESSRNSAYSADW